MVSGVLLAYWLDNLMYFAWGFTFAYIFLFVLSIVELYRRNLFSFSLLDLKETFDDFWKVIKPLLWLPFFLQGNIVVEKIVASYMGIETVAAVDYAKFITETGIVLLAIPIGYVGLSELSNLGQHETKEKLAKIIPLVLIFTLPLSIFIFWNSEIIISIVFERGAFDQESVSLTSLILMGLSIGFWAQVISYVLIKALSASFRNKEVLIYMLISLSLGALFNIAFYQQLGPITLGLGVSVYGISLLLLTLYAYKMLYDFLPIFMLMILGGIGYSFLVNQFVFDDIFSFVLSCTLFGIYWFIFFLLIPNTRFFVMQLFLKIRAKQNSN
jgi:putative peptidoglycan lipid II flippase